MQENFSETKLDVQIDIIKTYINLSKHLNSQGENGKAIELANSAIKASKALRKTDDSEKTAECLILAYDAILLGDYVEKIKDGYRDEYINFVDALKTHPKNEAQRYAEIIADLTVGAGEQDIIDILNEIDDIINE